MPDRRFVILRHEPGNAGPRELHWDLMLEEDDGLRTWAFPQEPALGLTVEVDELPVHRSHYLDYEGPVSNDRGSVSRIEQGTYSIVEQLAQHLVVDLAGNRLCARLELTRSDDAHQWTASLSPS